MTTKWKLWLRSSFQVSLFSTIFTAGLKTTRCGLWSVTIRKSAHIWERQSYRCILTLSKSLGYKCYKSSGFTLIEDSSCTGTCLLFSCPFTIALWSLSNLQFLRVSKCYRAYRPWTRSLMFFSFLIFSPTSEQCIWTSRVISTWVIAKRFSGTM